jgi:hypothetical protein
MPTKRAKCSRQKLRDLGLIAPCPADDVGRNCEIAEGRQDFVEFGLSGLAQDDGRIPNFSNMSAGIFLRTMSIGSAESLGAVATSSVGDARLSSSASSSGSLMV